MNVRFGPKRSIRALRHALPLVLPALLAGCGQAPGSHSPSSAADPWTAVKLIQPAELAGELKDSTATKPLLLHVGFRPLYRAGAIPGSRYVGPTSRADGISAMTQAVKDLPRTEAIVIYCGCCPWKDCPNMKPAARTLESLGFTNVRGMKMEKNFDTDWAGQGYPVEEPKQ